MDATSPTQALQGAQTVQTMFGGGPVAAFAGIFCIAFFVLLGWHLWRLHGAHQAHLESVIQSQLTVTRVAALEENLRIIRTDIERHHGRRSREVQHDQGP